MLDTILAQSLQIKSDKSAVRLHVIFSLLSDAFQQMSLAFSMPFFLSATTWAIDDR